MLHGRCDQMIQLLRLELADAKTALAQERQEHRESEERMIKAFSTASRPPAPIIIQRPAPPEPDPADLDLLPEQLDPENALFVGRAAPDTWRPPNFSKPRTASGQKLREKAEAANAAAQSANGESAS